MEVNLLQFCQVTLLLVQVTLKERSISTSFTGANSDLETVFSLFPVIQVSKLRKCFIGFASTSLSVTLQENETIEVESYVRIKHLQTRTWLHLEKGIYYDIVQYSCDLFVDLLWDIVMVLISGNITCRGA